MPMAKCVGCGELTRWRNGRGVRLSDMACAACGGRLRRATYDVETGEYVIRLASTGRGGRLVRCVACCARKRTSSGTVRELPAGSTLVFGAIVNRPGCWFQRWRVTFRAPVWICTWHLHRMEQRHGECNLGARDPEVAWRRPLRPMWDLRLEKLNSIADVEEIPVDEVPEACG